MSLPVSWSDGNVSELSLARYPEQERSAAGAADLGGESDRGRGAGGVHHKVELGGRRPTGADRRRRLGAGADGLAGAQLRGQLELFLTHPVGHDPSRRVQAQQRDCQRAECADADHADRLARLRPRLLKTMKHDRCGLDQHPGIERHVVGKPVHHMGRHRDQFRIASRAREPQSLDSLAPLRLAAATAPASVAADHALADDAVAHPHGLDVRPGLDDRARPLVSGDDRDSEPIAGR